MSLFLSPTTFVAMGDVTCLGMLHMVRFRGVIYCSAGFGCVLPRGKGSCRSLGRSGPGGASRVGVIKFVCGEHSLTVRTRPHSGGRVWHFEQYQTLFLDMLLIYLH